MNTQTRAALRELMADQYDAEPDAAALLKNADPDDRPTWDALRRRAARLYPDLAAWQRTELVATARHLQAARLALTRGENDAEWYGAGGEGDGSAHLHMEAIRDVPELGILRGDNVGVYRTRDGETTVHVTRLRRAEDAERWAEALIEHAPAIRYTYPTLAPAEPPAEAVRSLLERDARSAALLAAPF